MPKVYNKRHNNAPKGAVYIGRPSFYGNPFTVEKYGRDRAIALYEEALRAEPRAIALIKKELHGKDLVCWCAPLRCHGDILLKIANEE